MKFVEFLATFLAGGVAWQFAKPFALQLFGKAEAEVKAVEAKVKKVL